MKLLRKLRSTYPQAHIVCITTLLWHDANWDAAIEEVCSSLQDEKITHHLFTRNGKGTPGHQRIPEAEEMSDELCAYIESLNIQW